MYVLGQKASALNLEDCGGVPCDDPEEGSEITDDELGQDIVPIDHDISIGSSHSGGHGTRKRRAETFIENEKDKKDKKNDSITESSLSENELNDVISLDPTAILITPNSKDVRA